MDKLIKLRDLFILFILFSVCGWIYEVILTLIAYGWFENRGMLYGAWLPIYGCGGLILYYLLRGIRKKPLKPQFAFLRLLAVFVCICLVTAVVELAGSYILDLCGIGFVTLWNYNGEFLEFEGRVALVPTLRFGILGIVGLYCVVPLWERSCAVKKQRLLSGIAVIIALLFISDVVFSLNKFF